MDILTKRQYQILKLLIENQNSYISSNELANYFKISVRSIKNDLKIIKNYCLKENQFKLLTLPSKGNQIVVFNKSNLQKLLNDINKKINENINFYSIDRTLSLIQIFINTNSYTSKYQIMNKLFISESTLYKTIKTAREKLSKYKLRLIYKTNYGYKIDGNEIDKRMCILQNNLIYTELSPYIISEELAKIYNVVADTFIKFKYQINEITLQNITNHVSLAIQRVKQGNFVKISIDANIEAKCEYKISQIILNHFLSAYNISNDSFINETTLLTQTILGKGQNYKNYEINNDINEFINTSFILINQKFSVNFSNDETIKLYLALHLMPLFYRIKSKTQLKNQMEFEIRQSFPLAYDIAIYFSLLLKDHFDLDVELDEISFLSLYFNYGLDKINSNNINKKILILTDLRKSEIILLRHKILNWFPNQICEVNVANSFTDDLNINEYDAIFTTDSNINKYKGSVVKINIFPDEKDFDRINLAINGYTSIQSIVNKFSKNCFYYGNAKDKHEALKIVCNQAKKYHHINDNLLKIIENRENISPTYFGNHIALPHPLVPISEETFVSVAILNKPINWDNNHTVSIIMLISIEKNNPKAFQIWHYLSYLIRDEKILEKLLKIQSYDEFIDILTYNLKEFFK